MSKKKYKFKVVPFQLCPKCNGEGTIFKGIINPHTTATYGHQTCDLCNGAMVIPQALIPK